MGPNTRIGPKYPDLDRTYEADLDRAQKNPDLDRTKSPGSALSILDSGLSIPKSGLGRPHGIKISFSWLAAETMNGNVSAMVLALDSYSKWHAKYVK